MSSNMPFEADPPATPKPLDPVEATYLSAIERYERDREAHRANAVAEAWLEHEQTRKDQFTQRYLRDWYTPLDNPYEGLSPQEVYRLTRPYDTRIQDCLDAGCLGEAVRCFVFRNRSRVHVDKLKDFLRPYMPVDGTTNVRGESVRPLQRGETPVYDAEGISRELRELVEAAGLEFRRGEVVWILGYEEIPRRPDGPNMPIGWMPPERPVLAHQELTRKEDY